MTRRIALLSTVFLLAITAIGTQVRAQTVPTVVTYPAGWNMVGAPPQTDLSAAATLYVFTNGSYTPATTPVATGCQGYWAYFVAPVTIALSGPSGGPQQCSLQAGWNLVGNPYAVPAQLPNNVIAYYWNATAGRYDVVSAIPVGGAVWIYSSSAATITLQTAPPPTATPTATPTTVPVPTATPTPAPTLTISDVTNPGPYRVHVGDTIELLLSEAIGYNVTYNPQYLQLINSGASGPLSCIGDPSCALTFVNQFWIWQAVLPGTTYLTVTPICKQTTPPCTPSSQRIEIDILP